MSEMELSRSEPTVLLWHLALYGLAAILEDAGVRGVRTSWSPGMQPRARVSGEGLTSEGAGAAVVEHARNHTLSSSWVQRDVVIGGQLRGLMSPRLSTLQGKEFAMVQGERHLVLDGLTDHRAELDLRLIAGLGEPAYWRFKPQGDPLQGDGASRWDMQPRNRGSELVQTRLRKLAATVATYSDVRAASGLVGNDHDGKDAPGLPAAADDSTVSWCALWGIGQLPLALRARSTAVTTGHLGRPHDEFYYAPCWNAAWRPARLRSVIADERLRVVAATGLPRWSSSDADVVRARSWLATRGVRAVIRFPIARFGSDLAPERRALLGTPIRTAGSPAPAAPG